MQFVRRLRIPFAAAVIAAVIAAAVAPIRSTAQTHRPAENSLDLRPLANVHEFMEHVVEGNFATLKKALSEKPVDAQTWRSVRDTSLLLGESGNLLLIRKPDDANASDWSKRSIALRDAGDALSKAGKAKDHDASRRAYRLLVQACNDCHSKYGEDGEPKILP